MSTVKGGDLTLGTKFIDPRREGRRAATVIRVGTRTRDTQHVTLDDDTEWGLWAASYGLDEELELA
jgi:hypothetical protein